MIPNIGEESKHKNYLRNANVIIGRREEEWVKTTYRFLIISHNITLN